MRLLCPLTDAVLQSHRRALPLAQDVTALGLTSVKSDKSPGAKPMPDAAQSVPFWTSVARAFRGNDAVIFDLFNEPFPQAAAGSEGAGWQCWLRGGSACQGIGYPAAGMQRLVNAVRSAGANNVIMLGGIGWANDLTQWLRYEPFDPDHNLAASWHSYNFNSCVTASCWDRQVAPLIAKVPVIVGEMGENDCADTYINSLMKWLDARSASYLAWAWNVDFACAAAKPDHQLHRGANSFRRRIPIAPAVAAMRPSSGNGPSTPH